MEKVTILVVDNEEDQRRMLRTLLTRYGYDVETTPSGEKAIELIGRRRYPLVIADLIMPDMDGVELCERVKAAAPDIKVYACSGHADLYEEERMARAGFDGLISKPVQIEALRKALEAALVGA